jgi:hypothetical protein
MPDHSSAVPPSPEALRRFFRESRSFSIAEAASLVGWTPAEVKLRAREEDVLLRGNLVRWRDVAGWLVESWRRQWLLDALGSEAAVLPAGLHLTRPGWSLPYYIVHAMNVQWRTEALPHRTVRPATIDDYMSDLLHRAIDTHTVALLRRDPDFVTAYEFPHGSDD